MRKDRTRRYQSVLELADDIQNYLDGTPLSAGPESVVYRAKKFVRRNRAFVTGIAAVLAVLVAGVVISTLFAIKAERARVEAVAARGEAVAVSDFLRKDVLASMNPFDTVSPFATRGQEVTVSSVLNTASERLEGKFRDKPLVEASIRQTLGTTYVGLGLYGQAESHLKRALEVYQAQLGSEDPATLICMAYLGQVHYLQIRLNEAEPLMIDAMEGMKRVLGQEHPETLMSIAGLGGIYYMQGRYDEAETLYVEGLQASRRVFGGDDPNTARFMVGLGFAHMGKGNYEEAERLYTEVWKLCGRTLGEASMPMSSDATTRPNLIWRGFWK
jgi:tetratricopeptide (TPR) repeat protein